MRHQEFNRILLEEQLITNYTVNGVILGYEFKIRYPSWRGTYLSCIEKLEFRVDQELINPGDIYFTLKGVHHCLRDLKNLYKEYWYILDYATITVLKKGGIAKGIHELSVEMRHRIPYSKQDGSYPVLHSTVTRSLMSE